MRRLCIAASLVAASFSFGGAAEAASFTFSFTGKLTGCTGDCGVLPDPGWIIGEFTLNDPPETDFPLTFEYDQDDHQGRYATYANATWSAGIFASETGGTPLAGFGTTDPVFGSVDLYPISGSIAPTVTPTASFTVGGSDQNALEIDLSWSTNFFLSLSNFPAGGEGTGIFSLASGASSYSFIVTNYQTAVTPVPPALPLFLTAVVGLGFATWRKRRGTRTAAKP